MSRKDYVAMAEGVRTLPDPKTRKQTAEFLADICKKDNPRFDRQRFMTACEVGE